MPHVAPGVYNIMATPLDASGELDLAGLRLLVDFQLARGVTGLNILGNLGEVRYLTDAERDAVIETTIAQVAGRAPVIVGMGFSGAHATLHHARRAVRAGAAAVMVAPPAGVRGQEAIVDHYRRVGGGTPLPIVVYDEPVSSGVAMPPALLARIVETVPTAGVIKLEDPPTPAKLTQIRRILGDKAEIFGGLGGMFFLEELGRGAVGTMTGFAYAEILVAIYTRFTAGDAPGARSVFERYLPLIRYEAQPGIGLALRKEILRRRGALRTAVVRPPAQPLDTDTLAELDATLTSVGLADQEPVLTAR
ncbi:MAG TPA: dihydrodipicolinate synthase family protein [bacterium]|nr:dihydrodipicolinate synthase family protein [bacterium]